MKYYISILVLATFLVISCEKEIIIPQPDYQATVSIQGFLEPDSFPIVYFNRTTPFLSEKTSTGDLVIRNAIIKIIGNNATDILTLDSVYNRIICDYDYFYKGSILTAWNTVYDLEIVSNNIIYTASTNTNLNKVDIDSVSYTKTFSDVYGEHEGVIVYFKDLAGSTDYYRYEQTRQVDTTMKHSSTKLSFSNKCIGQDTIMVLEEGRSVYEDQNVDGQQIKIVIEPAYSHRKDLETVVKIQTVNKVVFDFYDQIDRQKLAQFNPFVEPVFLREGQFGSQAIGFFGSRTRSNGVVFVFPE